MGTARVPVLHPPNISPEVFSEGLTFREIQVLEGMLNGKTQGEIAVKLNLSESGVCYHKRNIFEKAGLLDDKDRNKTLELVNKFGHFKLVWVSNER